MIRLTILFSIHEKYLPLFASHLIVLVPSTRFDKVVSVCKWCLDVRIYLPCGKRQPRANCSKESENWVWKQNKIEQVTLPQSLNVNKVHRFVFIFKYCFVLFFQYFNSWLCFQYTRVGPSLQIFQSNVKIFKYELNFYLRLIKWALFKLSHHCIKDANFVRLKLR